MTPVRLSPVALAACFALISAPALAQRKPAPPKVIAPVDPAQAEAKRLFEEGVASYAKGNYEAAITAWERSYELSRKPLIFESIASAYERLGDPKKARDYLTRWREVAPREEWELLDAKIKNLDARVKREEQLEAQRKAEEEQARRAQEGREQALRDRASARENVAPLPAIVMMGVGGAAVAVGLTFDVIAGIKRPDAKSACTTTKDGTQLCRSTDANDIKSSNTFATVGDVTWIAGAVVGSAGAVWYFWKRGSAPKESAASTTLTPAIGLRGGGLSVVHTF